jgi:antirestriction protein ArdC
VSHNLAAGTSTNRKTADKKKAFFDTLAELYVDMLEKGLREGNYVGLTAPAYPTCALNGRLYSGYNMFFLLMFTRLNPGYTHRWATLKQWNELGARVKKGASGYGLLLPSKRIKKEHEDGTETSYVFWGSFYVFNEGQVEDYVPQEDQLVEELPQQARVDQYWAMVKQHNIIQVEEAGKASYNHATDVITVPLKGAAQCTWLHTHAHELIHWTASRVERKLPYSLEEIVADLGASLLMQKYGIVLEPDLNSLEYMRGFAEGLPKLIREDVSIFRLAYTYAVKAVEYLSASSTPDVE